MTHSPCDCGGIKSNQPHYERCSCLKEPDVLLVKAEEFAKYHETFAKDYALLLEKIMSNMYAETMMPQELDKIFSPKDTK